MTKKIRSTSETLPRIRDTSDVLPRISASEVAAALGAEVVGDRLEDVLAPITLFAVREELLKRLHSSGGRPALAGTTLRAKIPLSEEEWSQLERMAIAVASQGFTPSAGQVASVLLTLSVQSVTAKLADLPPPQTSRSKSGGLRRK